MTAWTECDGCGAKASAKLDGFLHVDCSKGGTLRLVTDSLEVGGIWSKYQPPAPEVTLTPGGSDAPPSSTTTAYPPVRDSPDAKPAPPASPPVHDPVKEPAHYKAGGLEAIDVIEAFNLNFRVGNVVKYCLRAGKKGATVEDLKKARQYLSREIAALEGRRGWE